MDIFSARFTGKGKTSTSHCCVFRNPKQIKNETMWNLKLSKAGNIIEYIVYYKQQVGKMLNNLHKNILFQWLREHQL